MKKLTTLSFFILSFAMAQSQELGYKTIDAGAEFQYYSKGYTGALHLAYNFPLHHALQLRIGYNKSNWKDMGKHENEEGGGPDFSLGYRYYFPVRPHGFFLGIKADVSRLSIDWKQSIATGTSKVWALQPAAEAGYMILINDQFFITPSVSAGIQTNIKTEGQLVGDGSIIMAGISTGWKF